MHDKHCSLQYSVVLWGPGLAVCVSGVQWCRALTCSAGILGQLGSLTGEEGLPSLFRAEKKTPPASDGAILLKVCVCVCFVGLHIPSIFNIYMCVRVRVCVSVHVLGRVRPGAGAALLVDAAAADAADTAAAAADAVFLSAVGGASDTNARAMDRSIHVLPYVCRRSPIIRS